MSARIVVVFPHPDSPTSSMRSAGIERQAQPLDGMELARRRTGRTTRGDRARRRSGLIERPGPRPTEGEAEPLTDRCATL